MKSNLGAVLILVTVCLAAASNSVAQEKPVPRPSPSPEKELLKVEAAPAATPAETSPQKPRPAVEEPVLVNTDLISFNITVTDAYGRFVSGLKQNAFTVYDEKQEQEISFFSDDDAPVSVGIVFDLTGSMSGEKVQRAKDALGHFFETSLERDEYFLITLQGGRAFLTVDRTRDSKAILEHLTFVQAKGNTAFYDGVYLAAERVQRGGTYPKRVVLVISDGQDNNSRYNFNELRKSLKESDVAIYCIGIEESGGSLAMEGSGILDEISGVSGGKAFFPRSGAEMDDIFEQIALELRHQYSIGYKPKVFSPDGSWHHLKVKVSPPRGLPRLFVRGKEGYFALANSK